MRRPDAEERRPHREEGRAMRFNQDKIDELMRLLKQARELFAENFGSEGDF